MSSRIVLEGRDDNLVSRSLDPNTERIDSELVRLSTSCESGSTDDTFSRKPQHYSNAFDEISPSLSSTSWFSTPSIYKILPGIFFLAVVQGSIVSPYLELLLTLVCRAHYDSEIPIGFKGDIYDCQTPAVHARLSSLNMWLTFLQGSLGAFVCPKLGAFSDRVGRKPIIAYTMCGPLISNVILIFASKSDSVYAYRYLFIFVIADAMTGSIQGLMATSMAYATDCTSPQRRTASFALFHALFLIGLAVGPALGGIIISVTDTSTSLFYIAVGVQAVFISYIILFLPESKSKSERRNAMSLQISEQGNTKPFISYFNILAPLRVLWPSDGTRFEIKRNIATLATMNTLITGVTLGSAMVVLLYAQLIFGWSSIQTGYFVSVVGFSRTFALLAVLPLLVKLFEHFKLHSTHSVGASYSDIYLIRATMTIEGLSFLGLGLSRNAPLFVACASIGSFGSIALPAIQSTATKHIPKEKSGAILGAFVLLQNLAIVVSPTLLFGVYSLTVEMQPRTVFYVITTVFSVAISISFLLTRQDGDLYDEADVLAENQNIVNNGDEN
ncbi:major facilitator superfamily domain-containing protein [Dipodascopsis uninucleata]